MLSLEFAVCDGKKPEFIKKQEVSGLLSSLGWKTTLSKIPVSYNILLYKYIK